MGVLRSSIGIYLDSLRQLVYGDLLTTNICNYLLLELSKCDCIRLLYQRGGGALDMRGEKVAYRATSRIENPNPIFFFNSGSSITPSLLAASTTLDLGDKDFWIRVYLCCFGRYMSHAALDKQTRAIFQRGIQGPRARDHRYGRRGNLRDQRPSRRRGGLCKWTTASIRSLSSRYLHGF